MIICLYYLCNFLLKCATAILCYILWVHIPYQISTGLCISLHTISIRSYKCTNEYRYILDTSLHVYYVVWVHLLSDKIYLFIFDNFLREEELITSAKIWFYIKYCFIERSNQRNTTNSQKEIGESSGKKLGDFNTLKTYLN